MALLDKIKNAWNAFTSRDPTLYERSYYNGYMSSMRPDRPFRHIAVDRTILIAIMNRIALDVSNVRIRHVKKDENGRYLEEVKSELNRCFNLNANLDQTSKAFVKDVVMSMFDEGCIAITPVLTDKDPRTNDSFDIYQLRVGKIVQWYPKHVRLSVYNEDIGQRQEIVLKKEDVAIVENPFYEVMNEPNSTFKRLVHKLALLDIVDEKVGSSKLDLIIQFPFTIKTEAQRKLAESRIQQIEAQLTGSTYGIAYADAAEKIVQLNRAVDNNLLKQIEYLTTLLFSQLGITESIMNGTADEQTMLNYENRTLVPILSAIVDSMNYKFISEKKRKEGQAMDFFRDPFRLVPIGQIAEFADKFTRNEIMSTNEFRQIIGMSLIQDEKADELRNKNLNPSKEQTFASTAEENKSEETENKEVNQNEV